MKNGTILIVLLLCALIPKFTTGLSKHRPLIVLSFDGFRYDYMKRVDTPNLDKLVEDGVTVDHMRSQFTTKTFVNHQSLATGLHAENHGIIDNSLYDPLYNETLVGSVYNDRFWHFNDDVVPIWIRNEWAGDDRYSAAQFPGCEQPYGNNRSLPTYHWSYNATRPYTERVDLIINSLTNFDKPANLAFMYFEGVDTAGHNYGPDTEQVNEQVKFADDAIGYLVDQLNKTGIYDQVNIVIVGDHGMAKVEIHNMYNLTKLVNVCKGSYKKYGSSPVMHILPAKNKARKVYRAFKAASYGKNFQVFKKEEIPERWHFRNNRRILPIIVVADVGYAFEDADLVHKIGYHGFDNDRSEMWTIFIARGPSFKKKFVKEVINNIDLFSLFSNVLEIPEAPNDGTFAKVKPFLIN